MADKFKVGDVVMLIKCYNFTELLGKEMTITELQRTRHGINGRWIGYGVDLVHNGLFLYPQEHQLKLKTFDGEQKVFDMFENPVKEIIKDNIKEEELT